MKLDTWLSDFFGNFLFVTSIEYKKDNYYCLEVTKNSGVNFFTIDINTKEELQEIDHPELKELHMIYIIKSLFRTAE